MLSPNSILAPSDLHPNQLSSRKSDSETLVLAPSPSLGMGITLASAGPDGSVMSFRNVLALPGSRNGILKSTI
jgi:hypothetical protein